MKKQIIIITIALFAKVFSLPLDTGICKNCNPCNDSIVKSFKFENPMALSDEERQYIKIRKSQCYKFHEDTTKHKANLTGGRSRKSIMNVVMEHLHELKYAYNQRLKVRPGFGGKIVMKYAIDEFGKVIYCEAVEDSIGDDILKKQIIQNIKAWKFENINKLGDVTEVVYPFVFTPPDYSEINSKYAYSALGIVLSIAVIIISIVFLNQNH
jgi:hypothetical protein